MRRRGIPIAWIGLIAVLLAFVVWHGWQTNIAPHLAEQRAQQQEEQPEPPPSEEQVKAQLQRNREAVSKQPPLEPELAAAAKKPKTSQMPKPDPKRDVMEYWWEVAPPKTKK
ncbi:MAG: hypothetical protein NZ874_04995 [Fimbriimonadales bacterium]|nr:hypothetical protein [Fimbriimonadales bacterium]